MKCWKHGPASVCPCDPVYETEVEELRATLERLSKQIDESIGRYKKYLAPQAVRPVCYCDMLPGESHVHLDEPIQCE